MYEEKHYNVGGINLKAGDYIKQRDGEIKMEKVEFNGVEPKSVMKKCLVFES